MLEKPNLPDAAIVSCLQSAYGLSVDRITFLPLGADPNTAVYRAVTADQTAYFVKLRSGRLDEYAVLLPRWLSDQGVGQVIAPIANQAGGLWARLADFTLTLYPFVEGRNGYETDLSAEHWRELGAALKRMHTLAPPPALALPKETYDPQWRERVKRYLGRAANERFDDPVAAQVAALLRSKRDEIRELIGRTEQLAQAFQERSPRFVVCHADIHAANVLIDADDTLYLVDWDTAMLAPKEHDLMFAGGGQYGAARTPQQEERLFYQGYGETQIDQTGLAYYRYERIIQDIAVYCDQLLLTTEGGADRELSLGYLQSNFTPGGVLDIARAADRSALGA